MLKRVLMVLAFIPAFAAGWARTSVPPASVAGGAGPGAAPAASQRAGDSGTRLSPSLADALP